MSATHYRMPLTLSGSGTYSSQSARAATGKVVGRADLERIRFSARGATARVVHAPNRRNAGSAHCGIQGGGVRGRADVAHSVSSALTTPSASFVVVAGGWS